MAYAYDTFPVNLDTGEGASNTITGMLRGARGYTLAHWVE
jgi:hypothetical protein